MGKASARRLDQRCRTSRGSLAAEGCRKRTAASIPKLRSQELPEKSSPERALDRLVLGPGCRDQRTSKDRTPRSRRSGRTRRTRRSRRISRWPSTDSRSTQTRLGHEGRSRRQRRPSGTGQEATDRHKCNAHTHCTVELIL